MQLFRTYVSRFFLGLALLLSISAANAALIKSYDFNGDLSDTLGNGLDLVASGGIISDGRYEFEANQGLRLDSALLDTSAYGIEIGFQIDDRDFYHKVIDFQNLASNFGLYISDGAVQFYNICCSVGSVQENEDFVLGLWRSENSIEMSVNGTSLTLDFGIDPNEPSILPDPDGLAVSVLNILNFFEDDFVSGQSESITGSADFIRIHDDNSAFGIEPVSAVPVPAAFWLFGTALIGLIGFGKRKARIAA